MLPSAVSLSIQVLRASDAKPEPEGRGVAAAISGKTPRRPYAEVSGSDISFYFLEVEISSFVS